MTNASIVTFTPSPERCKERCVVGAPVSEDENRVDREGEKKRDSDGLGER